MKEEKEFIPKPVELLYRWWVWLRSTTKYRPRFSVDQAHRGWVFEIEPLRGGHRVWFL